MQQLPAALQGLAAHPQFILYSVEPSKKKPGKLDKFPVNNDGQKIDAHDSQYWMTAQNAFDWAAHHGGRYGVAFVLSDADPFFFLDIDSCNVGGQWSELAQTFMSAFNGCAVEVSTSGNGLHILGTGTFADHAKKNRALNIELYTRKRFIALTGRDALGDVNTVVSPEMAEWLVTYYFPKRKDDRSTEWGDGPVAEWDGPTDDTELIRRACNAVNASKAFTGRASFADLWNANTEALARTYPPDSSSSGQWDGSSADMALATHLAFWTGCDCERIERLMKQSALVREKWDREEYITETIIRACNSTENVCKDRKPEPLALNMPHAGDAEEVKAIQAETYIQSSIETFAPTAALVQGTTYLSPEQQIELFNGCVAVVKESKVWTPGGGLLSRTQFVNAFGGYTFIMDRENAKTTFDPWDAFVNSRAVRFPKVFDQCFRPDLDAGCMVRTEEDTYINTYRQPRIATREGDISKFWIHLCKLLPNENDRLILLYYLAALVQHRGTKFRWATVLQGVEGNGKTAISQIAAYAVGREYVHWPTASKLDSKFNGWMYRRLLYCVEDFGPTNKRDAVMEELKPMITGRNLEIEGKGIDQESKEIVGNFLFNTNHRGAVRKTGNDRRMCILYTAQQQFSDLERDGMDEKYMTDLFNWLEGTGLYAQHGNNFGYAIVANYLATIQIPYERNPAGGCQRAPLTSSTDSAISDSRGAIEQSILEAVDEQRRGFRGDFISNKYLKELLQENGHSITPARRELMMRTLGYEPHPGLQGGRPATVVLPDAGRPILYVRTGSMASAISNRADICALYTTQQQDD